MGNVCCARSIKKVGGYMMPFKNEYELVKESIQNILLELAHIAKKVSIKSNEDLVTTYDTFIEKALIDAILKVYPNDAILSEETHQYTKLKDRTWIIDPIDGTTNFVAGLPLYCIQMALYDKGEIKMSYLYMPQLKKEYYAIKGFGTYLNGKRIYSNQEENLSNNLISFVGIYRKNENGDKNTYLEKATKHNMKVRALGSVGVELAFVAEGISLACFTKVKNLWDIAPGLLLCMEAGAYIEKEGSYQMGVTPLFVWGNKQAYLKFND